MLSISIVGVGRLGGALALALSRSGYRVSDLIHRSLTTAEAVASEIWSPPALRHFESLTELDTDIVLITAPDPDIRPIAERLSAILSGRPIVLHTSGSLSSDELISVEEKGFHTGSVHPLVSISDPLSGSERFRDAFFCIEGSDVAVRTAADIAASLGGKPFSIPADKKALYHAAAVTSAGHLVALVDISIGMLSQAGLDPAMAKKILLPLIRSTVQNLESQPAASALTGTFARGDIAAFERHLSALKAATPDDDILVYLLLALHSVGLAAKAGSETEALRELRERIMMAKSSVQ